MIRFRLSAEDAGRLGCGEILEYDEAKLRLSEAKKLQKITGWHPNDLAEGLKKGDADAIGAIVWLALLRNGIEVPYDELDFDLGGLVEEPDEEPESAGKDLSIPATT